MKDYSTSDIAAIFGVSRHTARVWLQQGKVKGYKLGRSWRITPDEVDRIRKEGLRVDESD